MGLAQVYRDTYVLEAAENYSRADDPLTSPGHVPDADPDPYDSLLDDNLFWGMIMSDPESAWNKTFTAPMPFALSEWVPRVPGMYWHGDSMAYHDLASKRIEQIPNGGQAYSPMGKSMVVSGGIGTLKLPQDAQGRRLVTLTMRKNASVGIPLLVYPEVWEHHQLKESTAITGEFQWRKMDREWVQYFSGSKNIVRGYLEVRHPDKIETAGEVPLKAHPFTIMEYEKAGRRYYDFMFFTLHQSSDRQAIKSFLENYATHYGHGRYLLECDMNEPIFNGQYADPADFRANGREHLEFMETRMHEALSGSEFQDQVYDALSDHYYSNGDLVRVSTLVQIAPALWNIDGAATDNIVSFLNEVNQKKQMHALVEIIRKEHPDALPL